MCMKFFKKNVYILFYPISRYPVDLGLDLQRACAQESHLAPAQRAHPGTASTPATLQRRRTPLTWYVHTFCFVQIFIHFLITFLV